MDEYSANPYEEKTLYRALKKKYRDLDDNYLKHSRPFLTTLVARARDGKIEAQEFIDVFHQISTRLVEQHLLDNLERSNMFLTGLPKRIVSKIVKVHQVDQGDASTIDYKKFYQTALATCKADEVVNRFQEDQDPRTYNAKMGTIDEIVKEMTVSKQVAQAPRTQTEPSKNATTNLAPQSESVDRITDLFKELTINQSEALRQIGKDLQSVVMQNQNAPMASNWRQSGQHQGRGGFRGRGRGFGYSGMSQSYGNQAGNNPGLYQVTQVDDTVNMSAAYNAFERGPMCLGCFGLNRNGAPEQEFPHTHSDRCPHLQELISKGVCHKNASGRLALGPWDPNAEELYFRRDTPWIRQILLRTNGTRYDANLERRPENIRQEERHRQEALQAQMRPAQYPALASGTNPADDRMTIIRRPESLGAEIAVQHYGIVDDYGRDIDDLLEERVHAIDVSAAEVRTRKPATVSSAKELFRKRAAAEERLATPKSKRPSAYVPYDAEEVESNMDIDEEAIQTRSRVTRANTREEYAGTQENQLLEPQETQETLQHEEKQRRKAKIVAPLPKKTKGFKGILENMKSGHPALAIRDQFRSEMAHWTEFFQMSRELETELMSILGGKLPRDENFLHKRDEGVINVGSLGTALDQYANEGWIVSTPKLDITVAGPKSKTIREAMVDTGAEANVLPTSLARALGCPILGTQNLKMRTVSGQIIQFAGMSKVFVEIAHGVSCETVFFLVDHATLILLGQPFARKMKLSLEHPSDGSMDATFTDPSTQETCTVTVVTPLQQNSTVIPTLERKPRSTQRAYVEEWSEEEEN
jgi:hypothetical protein